MKLKYSKVQHTEILHRRIRKDKKAKKRIRSYISKITVRIVLSLILFTALYITLITIKNKSDVFIVKNVKTIVYNDKNIVPSNDFSFLKGENIFDIGESFIDSIVHVSYSDYGLKALIKNYPSEIIIIIYKKIPVISINNKFTVYQDFSIKKVNMNTNIITMNSDISSIQTGFDIPGFATLFHSLIKYKKNIKSICFSKNLYTIYTKDNRRIIIRAGNTLSDIDRIPEEYMKIDLRFNNLVLVKK